MTEHFDALIVGSGFGGSVMAYRLADAGLTTCLLERGKPFPPNSFPRSPHGFRSNFWDPSEGFYGMFNVWGFRGLNAVVSSGLGGGSLIYANVLLRKDEKWFVKDGFKDGVYEYWPVTRADLDPHYDRVEKMMNAQRYPLDHPPYNATPKTLAMQAAAKQLGLEWMLPPLAVTFANAGKPPVPAERIEEEFPNLHGLQRTTCRLCGECDVGCNYGSKNTLDYNYLSRAKLRGADIRTRSEVRSFRPGDSGGYVVEYVVHDPALEGKKIDTKQLPVHTVTASRLILSAGTLGSTYLLLKNRAAFPHVSATLGSRFCGNGDLLSLVFKCCDSSSGVPVPRIVNPSYGPVITSAIRVPDETDGGTGRGFYLEDAGYPEFVNWMVETANAPGFLSRLAHFLKDRVWALLTHDPKSDITREVTELLGIAEISAGTMPLLGMGRDRPDGNMTLRKDGPDRQYLDVDWQNVKSRPYFERVTDTSRRIAEAMGGSFKQNPATELLNYLITVHPLGGCPMGRNDNEGVVSPTGEVFNYPNFYIADGSVMPGPVGANPSLTIAALSDRFADGIIESKKGN